MKQDAPRPKKTPFERMTALTRRLIAVPKSELPIKRKRAKPKRRQA
jgi:hypothetical protein